MTMIFEIIWCIQLSSTTFTFLILETINPLVLAFPKMYIHNAMTDTVKAAQKKDCPHIKKDENYMSAGLYDESFYYSFHVLVLNGCWL